MNRGVVGLMTAAVLALRIFAGAALAAEQPEIRVGSELDFQPYAFADKDGQATGFSTDLIKAVAHAMGLRLRITTGPWDEVWNGLVAGQFDILPTVARAPGRDTLVDFSLPHTETFDAFFRRAGQPAFPNLAAAAGKEIVVLNADAAQNQLLERHFAGKVIPVDSIPDGLRLIAAGKHDAFLCSKLVATLEMHDHGIRGVTAGPPIPDYKRVFSFAVHKGNAELLEKLNQGLLIVKSNGEYDRIYRRWLTVEKPWGKWQPYFKWVVVGLIWLVGMVAVLQWLVLQRTRELTRANEKIAAEVTERRKAQDALQQLNATLEQRITERTAELQQARKAALNLMQDAVAARQQADQIAVALHLSERRIQQALRVSHSFTFEWATATDAVLRSASCGPILGLTGDEAVNDTGQRYFQRVHPDDRARFVELLGKLTPTNASYTVEYRITRGDGNVVMLEEVGQASFDAAGKLDGLVGVTTDITARKTAEEALAVAHQRLQSVIDNTPAIVYALDLEERFVMANAALASVLRSTPEQMIGKRRHEFMPQEDADWHEADDRKVIEAGRALEFEEYSQLPGRSITWLTTKFPLRDAQGRIYAVAGISADITTRKQAEEQTRQLHEVIAQEKDRLSALVNSITDEIWFADAAGQFTLVNPAASCEFDLTGDRATEVRDLAASLEVLRPDGSPRPIEESPPLRALRGEVVRNQEEQIRTPATGELRWRQVNAAPVRNTAGQVIGSVSVVRDITERKQAEAARHQRLADALHLSEQEFRALAEAMPQIVWATRADGWNIYFNQQWVDYTGMTMEESYGHGWNTPFHPDDKPRAWEAWQRATQHHDRYSLECRLRRHDGVYRWWLIRGEPMRAANGEILKWFGTCTDIEDIKRAEAALREANELLEQRVADRTAALQESEERFRTMANAMPQLAWIANADGWIHWYNQRWYDYTGTTPEQMEGWGWQSVQAPGALPKVLEQWKASIATGKPFEMTFPLRGAGGVFRLFLTRGIPLKDATGRVTQWFGTNTDVTELKQAEEKLRRLNRTLEALTNSDRALIHATDEAAFLREVCRIIVVDCGYVMVWVGYAENDDAKTVRPAASAGFAAGYLDTLQVTWADTERGRGPTGTAIRTGQVCQCRNFQTDPQFAPWRAEAIKRGFGSSAAFPLLADGKAFGALTIYAKEPDGFDEDEVKLLAELAGDFAYGISTLRLRKAHAQTEKALRLSEAQFRLLFEANPSPMWVFDEETLRFLAVNEAAIRHYGYSLEEFRALTILDIRPPEERDRLKAIVAKQIGVHNANVGVFQHCKKDGTVMDVDIVASSIAFDGRPGRLVLVKDVTDQRRAERELRRAHEQLEQRVLERTADLQLAYRELQREMAAVQRLEKQVLAVTEMEQQRIGRDLHDGICQMLTGITYHSGALRNRWAKQLPALATELDRLGTLAEATMEEGRRVAHGLFPVRSEPKGLMIALQTLAASVSQLFKVKCQVVCPQPVLVDDNERATHLYRIAQEATHNARRHGHATAIEIRLHEPHGALELLIRDNGRGLPPARQRGAGMGLKIMKYRANLIGATIQMRRGRLGGTVVRCHLPRTAKPPIKKRHGHG